jgi:hypothetical protein
MKLTQRKESGLCPFVCAHEKLILSRALNMKNTDDILSNILYRGEHCVYRMHCLLWVKM